jgi:phosphate-selective porin OprO/OprP
MFWKNKSITTAAIAALATAAGVSAAQAQTAAPAPTHTTSWTGTVGEDRFGEARFKMRGRFQYDIYSNDWDVGTEEGTRSYVRRAFLGVQGRFSEQWRYKLDFVLGSGASGASSGSNEDEVAVDDAFLEYVGDNFSVVIGEHNITSPLEDRISSLDIPFNERSSAINAFEYGRAAGIGIIGGGANWSASGAVQGDSLNNQDNSFVGNEALTTSGRFTFAPIFETAPEGVTLVHLGVSVRHREAADGSTFQYRTRPLNGRGSRHVDTGGLGQMDTSYGAEVAAQFGRFGVQAEYMTLNGETPAGAEYDMSGYYVDAYVSLTGESRSYRGNQGSFGAIVPRRSVVDGGMGHWMASARYDFVDLSDAGGANRGEQTAYSVGLDWIPMDHVRFKLNYAMSDMERIGAGLDEEAQVVSLRTQFDF